MKYRLSIVVLAVLTTTAISNADAQHLADTAAIVGVDTPPPAPRRHAISYSDAYYTRLTIHRVGSYTMLPLFASEWYLGDRLLNGTNPPGWMKPTHVTVATAIGALFTINTVTGVWNLWDSRQDPSGRTRRYLHTGLMLASDAGFVWASAVGGDAQHNFQAGRRHRDIALGSIGLSTAGAALMWFWKQ